MYLYKIESPDEREYDAYDSAVVVAESLDAAKLIHPDDRSKWEPITDKFRERHHWLNLKPGSFGWMDYTWADNDPRMDHGPGSWIPPERVIVKLIGIADPSFKESTVVVSSFNAG
jgi:hypothetical protein